MSEKIEKIMDREEAESQRDVILEKLGLVDLNRLTDFKVTEQEAKEERLIIQGIMTGLVYYDDEKACLVQKLKDPITIGTLTTRTHFYYKNKYKVSDAKASKFSGIDESTNMLSKVCELPMSIVDALTGLDLEMSMACLSFFLK